MESSSKGNEWAKQECAVYNKGRTQYNSPVKME